eukprot:c26107_g1_i1.p1 GENE.c26107_g1_i1~~c26107_g1_i1.p1  ORF type:complete len:311 (+),score=69.42 c26107_g1_i1:44-976(+)
MFQRWRRTLISPTESERHKTRAANDIRQACIRRESNKANQQEAVDSGCVHALVQLAGTASTLDCKVAAFQALAQVCFNNEPVSHAVTLTTGFIEILSEILEGNESSDLKEMALRSATNSAGNTWGDHPRFMALVPSVIRGISEKAYSKEFRAECVGFINVLAYNEKSRPQLIEFGAIDPLVTVMRSGDLGLEYTTATIALANLVGDCLDHPVLSCAGQTKLMSDLVACFEATLHRQDFPPNSGLFFTPWKLSMSISRLCQHSHNKAPLREAGLVPILRLALEESDSQDQAVVAYSLRALWNLSFEPDQSC